MTRYERRQNDVNLSGQPVSVSDGCCVPTGRHGQAFEARNAWSRLDADFVKPIVLKRYHDNIPAIV